MILIQASIFFLFFTSFLIQARDYFYFFIDCGIDLDLLSNEEINKLRNGEMFQDECDSLSMKMTMGIINFCVTTDAVLKYLMTHVENVKLT